MRCVICLLRNSTYRVHSKPAVSLEKHRRLTAIFSNAEQSTHSLLTAHKNHSQIPQPSSPIYINLLITSDESLLKPFRGLESLQSKSKYMELNTLPFKKKIPQFCSISIQHPFHN